ncbi:MAG: A/G-specific adenine glycosylase [Candidatus Cloacimonetes bacterium]|nr:A/G-specific adenine glycosylase [Candidatus Cloacimonadota bacterium]
MSSAKILYDWYLLNKRDLPWRVNQDPYRVMVSEIMLQQTRVEAVIPKYNAFIKQFPDLKSLALAKEQDVLIAWQGLGYYSRAKNLQKACKTIYRELENSFPKYYVNLIKLPGIGDYTASAVSSICFNEKRPVLDGNVIRIVSRIFKIDGDPKLSKVRQSLLERIQSSFFYDEDPSNYNQAMMELGALICVPKAPKCHICPISHACKAFNTNSVDLFPVKPKKLIKEKVFLYFYLSSKDKQIELSKETWKNYQSSYISPPFYESHVEQSDVDVLKGFGETKFAKKVCFSHSITKYKIAVTVYAKSLEDIELYRQEKLPKSGFLIKALKKFG